MSVLGEFEGVIRATQGAIEVAVRVDRLELRQPRAGLAATGDDALVVGPDDLYGTKTPQAVGDNGGRRRDRARGKPPPPRP